MFGFFRTVCILWLSVLTASQRWRIFITQRGSGYKVETSISTLIQSRTKGPTIGLAVGGAKDVVNFRKKIKSSIVPKPTDITNEGIFYEYYFDTSGKAKSAESTKLFYPSYSSAVCKNPLTQETECYLSVGLNSNIKYGKQNYVNGFKAGRF